MLARSAQQAVFHQYLFDGWNAEVDGKAAILRKDENGLCLLDLTLGTHEVRLRFTWTPAHRFALALAAVGWILLALAVARRAMRRYKSGCIGSGESSRIGEQE